MKIFFIRHGEPCRNSFGITDNGKNSIKLLADRLHSHKISALYSSTHQRAEETTRPLAQVWQVTPIFLDWLAEFKHPVVVHGGKNIYPWELPPTSWVNDSHFYDREKTMSHPLYASGNIGFHSQTIFSAFDALLKTFGYYRTGNMYTVMRRNSESIVIVSHFATISVICSHLLNVPLAIMLNMFWFAPASLNILQTEEQEKGSAIFRCIALNDCTHLQKRPDLYSWYGLGEEIFDNSVKH